MDPLGFALENFDTVGEFRAVDPQTHTLIDTAATMPDGTRMTGPRPTCTGRSPRAARSWSRPSPRS